MNEVKDVPRMREETPVDDVRRVRTKQSQEANDDVNRLADRAREIAEALRDKLGLKRTVR
ncbi:MAG: hypothetical protein AMXMBFR47_02680 [Planctomycetota bacterium]